MTVPTRLFAPLLGMLTLGLTSASPAEAGTRKKVEIQFQNNAYNQSMRCTLVKRWVSKRFPRRQVIGRYVISGKSTRPESERHLPVVKQVWVSPVVRRLSGENLYPKLQMTCSLDDNSNDRNEATSLLWDHASQSFDEYHLWAGCTHGAPCGVAVER